MTKKRFHLITLAHLPQNREYMSCAFTQKNIKMAKMLLSLGHEVFFYASEGSDIGIKSDRLHYVATHSLNDIREDYGDGDNRFEIGYDWTNTDFRHDFNTERKPSTLKFYAKCIEAINRVKRPDDFLLLSQGYYHEPIKSAVKMFLNCEFGIGYRGSVEGNFRAFESSYIQNFTYGSEHPRECIDGSHYDRVIPNYFEPDDFEFNNTPDDYFLFIGRMIKRKGILIAARAAEVANKKLIIVGQGAHVTDRGTLLPNTDPDFELPKGNWEYLGFADPILRSKLMRNAVATFTPTEYLECFAGTHVESRLCGTPVITTNFGVYPGTVENDLDGYRCDTMDDFVWAANNIHRLDRQIVRKRAEKYLMDYVKWEFEKWFDDLHCVWESAQDANKKGFNRIRTTVPEWAKILRADKTR